MQPWGEAAEDMRAARLGMILLRSAGAKQVQSHDVIPWLRRQPGQVTDWDAKRRAIESQMLMAGVRFVRK